jgi:hypothetical protein
MVVSPWDSKCQKKWSKMSYLKEVEKYYRKYQTVTDIFIILPPIKIYVLKTP